MIHLLVHTHRFGETNYLFNSADVMDTEVNEDYDWDDKNLNRLLEFLHVDFEPERGESIVIESFPFDKIPDFDAAKH